MSWTIPDHRSSAEEAIARGLMQGDLDVLSGVPEPLQSTQHQARVMALSVLNATAGPAAVLDAPWEPGRYPPGGYNDTFGDVYGSV